MALHSRYQQYLARPALDQLAPGATLHYLPSATSISEPAAILKHLKAQLDQVKAKHNFVNAVESATALCAEAETTLSFGNGCGAYVPGLDDNFVADRIITLPTVHSVSFDGEQRIQQIRVYWDQGALLKSLDVIGSRGKNWPIVIGPDQAKLLVSAADSSLASSMGGASLDDISRPQARGGANADKYTSLNLFAPRNHEREEPRPVESRGASNKPPERDYYDLFSAGADPDQLPDDPSGATSPSKQRNPLKAGAGKNYNENRLFDQRPLPPPDVASPDKASSKRYEHFEFGETPFQPDPSKMAKHNKHGSKWDFADFTTPLKPKTKQLAHQVRNFSWSDDEDEAARPAVTRPHKPQPRPDAETHFDLTDEPTPKDARAAPPSRQQNARLGLYEDHVVLGEDEGDDAAANAPNDTAAGARPLTNVTNVNLKGQQKTFGSQFKMTDEPSPGGAERVRNENAAVPEARKKVAQSMQPNWQMEDETPTGHRRLQGIHIEGDGMGGRKNPTEKPWWEY